MGTVNKVMLVGNLGRDAELKYVNGAALVNLSVATSESWTDKTTGNKVERTEWTRVQLWGKPAETLAEYLVKGKQVYVEGRLQTRKWEKEGQTHFTTEVRCDRLVLLGGGKNGPSMPPPTQPPLAESDPEVTGDGLDPEVPF